MPTKRWIALLCLVAIAAVLLGCGTATTTSVSNEPPPAGSPIISIAFQPAPPGAVLINATTALAAVVSSDSTNSGVDWSLICPKGSSSCGSLSALHTTSGAPVTYSPPLALSGNTEQVSILAFATADHTKNVQTSLAINAFGNALKGTYVLQARGSDVDLITGNAGVSQFAGVVTLDGNGGITTGEQTYTDASRSTSDPITGGSYFVGADGRGSLTLRTADVNIGQQGLETFSLVVLSSSHALIAKTDDPNLPGVSNETSVGSMDLQTSVIAPKAGYAFVLNGTDIASGAPLGMGGILNIDSPNAISGAGSVADQDLAGTVTPKATISGTVSSPDPFGAVKFTLMPSFLSTPLQLTGYIVDATHISLIEADANGVNLSGAATAGVAISQGSATGTFTKPNFFNGTYVFGIFGQDLSQTQPPLPTSLSSAGVFTADGAGHLNAGFNDVFFGGFDIAITDQFHGKYVVDSTGTGRVDSSTKYATEGNGAGPELIFYLTGNGNPPLILDVDSDGLGGAGVGTGIAYPTTGAPVAFSGKYGVSFTEGSFGTESDATGEMLVDPTAQSLVGTVDTNEFLSPAPDTALAGTFAASATPNRFDGILSNELFPSDLTVAYYLIDANHGIFVENDFLQLTFGYFATRTPVCPSCP